MDIKLVNTLSVQRDNICIKLASSSISIVCDCCSCRISWMCTKHKKHQQSPGQRKQDTTKLYRRILNRTREKINH
jgi:hypothetical protein